MDKLRRSMILGGGLSLAFPNWPVFASSLKYNLKAQRIANNTYVVIGKTEDFSLENGGDIVNVAFIDTSEGVVLIDTGPSRRYGQALKKLIFDTTGKDVIRVYNTHYHPDHCLGNQLFDKRKIAALPKTISGLKASGEDFSGNLYRLLGDWMRGTEVVLPEKVINYSSEKFGKHRFEMLPFEGHTDADLAILDHETGVLFTGDICFLDRAATTPHADLEKWHKSLSEIKKIPHKILFPGHGPADVTNRSIDQTDMYLKWLGTNLTKAVREGKDMIEAAKIPIPEKFSSINLINLELERSVAHLYPKIEEKTLPFLGQGDG